jgi:polyhydroxyalkanoate synthesis regulator phasin
MKKIIKLTEKDIHKLVQKIIKEDDSDDYEWVPNLDINRAEKIIKKNWFRSEHEYGVDIDDLFELITDNGILKKSVLDDIGDELYNQFDRAYEEGKEYARDNYCTCDGCCDDFIYYDDHRQEIREARDEAYEEGRSSGFDDGYEEGKDSRDDEVEGLESKIEELEERITDLESELEDSNSEDLEVDELESRIKKLQDILKIKKNINNES